MYVISAQARLGLADVLSIGRAYAMTNGQWELVADLFDPPGRRGPKAKVPRRQMVEAVLWLARTGCQWRERSERYGRGEAV